MPPFNSKDGFPGARLAAGGAGFTFLEHWPNNQFTWPDKSVVKSAGGCAAGQDEGH
ncbi:hypothetical protein [Arthrobacter methylotrophus]|uniref:hypothetical protein n=1 Tax=Arthrobacter methylotrophus TaxID=121291 RepID=UPI0031EF262A